MKTMSLDKTDGLRTSRVAAVDRQMEADYFAAARSGELDVIKGPEREKVLRHILDNHSKQKPRILTNPGLHWKFERMVEHERGEYQQYFVGVERSWQILENSLRHMPGRRKIFFEDKNNADRRTAGVVSAKAAVIYGRMENIVSTLQHTRHVKLKAFARSRLVKPSIRQTCANWTAFWIDVFSPLGTPAMALLLRRMRCHYLRTVSQIPFAITFQYGRDAVIPGRGTADPLDVRVEMIKSELESKYVDVEISDAWWYFNLNDSRIATVAGIAKVKPEYRQQNE